MSCAILTGDAAAALLVRIDAEKAKRREAMPDEKSAISTFFDAWLRLKELGWSEAIYCPKDGSEFEVIEPGSTGIHICVYRGEWPKGSWWIICEDGDEVPSHPCLWQPRQPPTPHGGEG